MRLKPLMVVFTVDGLISVGFGLASWLFPFATYGTIVDLGGMAEGSLTLSALRSLSAFYVFVGAVCLCAAFMPPPHNARIAAVMIVRHAWIGLKGFWEADRDWIVGDPWTDLYIHGLFVIAYAIFVLRGLKSRQVADGAA